MVLPVTGDLTPRKRVGIPAPLAVLCLKYSCTSPLNLSIPRRVDKSGKPYFWNIADCAPATELCNAPTISRNLSVPPTRSVKYLSAVPTPSEVNSVGSVISNSSSSSSAVFLELSWRATSSLFWFCDSIASKNEVINRPSGVLRT